jgi:2,4-dienoyl-CoA reductase-like NADH-dependent reductase (Old Yellow Enzyme family)/thioredoxin reductase
MSKLNHAFAPLEIGPIQIANRLCMSCMAGGYATDKNGYPNERMIAYYVERAKSRPGMMGVGAGAVVVPAEPETRHFAPVLYNDGCIEPFRRFTDAIHEYDTKFGIQLWDGGIQSGARVQLTPSGVGINATAVGDVSRKQIVHALEADEIPRVVKNFGDAAERCVAAGFDFVEIHGGHGYLISNFLTPHFNLRTDEYGGSFENRIRFLIEILREVKHRVGDRLAVGVKINGEDYLPENGWTLEDACRIAPILEAEGAHYISATAGVMGAPRLTVPPLYEPQACFLDLGVAMKKAVNIPVSIVGRIKNPVMADELIRDGKVDMVFMGRPMIADPELVEKARTGALEDIRPCLADCRGCLDHQMRSIKRGETPATSCIVNPRVGREIECIDIAGDKKDNPKTILVAGGGCAGMEAARHAAFSGHKVILCDSAVQLGGQLRLAERIPGRHEIGDILPWYERQLARLGVDIRLGTTVDQALVASIVPDIMVVATGSLPSVPQNFMTSLMNARAIEIALVDDVLRGEPRSSGNILVIGGDQVGMQAADYLSEGGAKVWIAEETGHFAAKLAANDRWYLTNRLRAKGVTRIKYVSAVDILEDDRVCLTTASGEQELPALNMVVLANERQSNRGLAEITEKMAIKTHIIGDADDVQSEDSATIFANIAQGYDTARYF